MCKLKLLISELSVALNKNNENKYDLKVIRWLLYKSLNQMKVQFSNE